MKLKSILIIAGIVLLAGLSIWFNSVLKENKKLKADKIRLENNQSALLQREEQYKSLNLTQKEALKASSLKIDSISTLLKIRPKTIERIVYQTVLQHDTTVKLVPVEKISKNEWKISDSDKCFMWQGIAKLNNDSLNVSRTKFDYKNETINTFWKTRRFWIFSKWKFYQQSLSTCGKSFTTEVSIKKK